MAIVMHDLAGADPALRFSPYCWRTRMALAHKGLAVETIPWRFTDKAALAFSGQERVPVIRDGDTVVSDSWTIARIPGGHISGSTKPVRRGHGPGACKVRQCLGGQRDDGRHRAADPA